MTNRHLYLLLIFILISFPLQANDLQSLTIGGLLRIGSLSLVKSAEQIETKLSYDDESLSSNLGKFLFVNYYYSRFGIGARWMAYRLEGDNDQYEQVLNLEYTFLTLAIRFLEGNYLHPDIDSRFGFLMGQGRSQFELTTTLIQPIAGQSSEEKTQSLAEAVLIELFFESIADIGFGYRIGYFAIKAEHDDVHNDHTTDASTQPNMYFTIIWQF